MTDAREDLDLSQLDKRVNPIVIDEFSYDYSKIPFNDISTKARFTASTFFRWELFNNVVFREFDNALYLDSDTEVCAPIGELFKENPEPTIGLVAESGNPLKDTYGMDVPKYLSAGVMFLTPKALGGLFLSLLFIDCLHTVQSVPMQYVDQDALNIAIQSKKFNHVLKVLPGEYNWFSATKYSKTPNSPIKIWHHVCSKGRYERKWIENPTTNKMKNALVYVVNDNQKYVDCMVNSINSFYANNPKSLLDTVKVLIFSNTKRLNLRGLRRGVKKKVITKMSYDYDSVFSNYGEEEKERFSIVSLWKLELFHNPLLRKFDNVLFLDGDTVVEQSIEEMFQENQYPLIMMAEENSNLMREKGVYIDNYCNTGVILFSPSAIGNMVLDAIFDYDIDIARNSNIHFIAQDDINQTMDKFNNYLGIIEQKYNCNPYMRGYNPDDCKIRHYPGSRGEYEKKYLKNV